MSNELMVIARNTTEMAIAQKDLVAWAEQKMAECITDAAEITESLAIAIKNKWRTSGLKVAVRIANQKREFYQKIGAAVRLGYVIVPNFPIDVFAIRTNRKHPLKKSSEYTWSKNREQGSEAPAIGEGQYVSASPVEDSLQYEETDSQGKTIQKREYFATEFRDVYFPIKAIKPEILDDAGRAMAHQLFDEIGLCPQAARRDPMIIGQIIYKPSKTVVSFLVTWWLTNRDLEV